MVFKGEAVYTTGRQFNVTSINQPNGLVRQNIIDYALGVDFNLPADTRFNLQFFQRVATNHDPDTLADKYESGISVLIDGKLGKNVEARAFRRNWRLASGVDIFSGRRWGCSAATTTTISSTLNCAIRFECDSEIVA